MGDKKPPRTLGDYSRPSHEGYQNTIELPEGNNVVPLRSDTIRLVQNGCAFYGLRSEDPNQHLKDFLKLVDSLDLNVKNRERTRLRLFQISFPIKLAIGLNWSSRHLILHGKSWQAFVDYTSSRTDEAGANNFQKDQPQVKALTVNKIETLKLKEPKRALEDEFKDLHLKLPVLEVLAHAPMYNAILDKYVESLELGKNGSAIIQGEMTKKMKDPGLFTFPCRLGNSKPFDTDDIK
ncbi:hypothetical protein Tco_1328175 [Tanacetum coccineum]